MKASQHGNLIKLTRMGWVNCYFVIEDDGLTLIDTGIKGSANGILAAAEEIGQPVKRIALTHGHADHASSLDALADHFDGVDVGFGVREARLLRGDRSLDPDEPKSKLRGSFVKVKTEPTIELRPGDRLASLEVVAAAGHTPGQLAFLDLRDRTLIAGDAFTTLGGTAVPNHFHLRFPLAAMGTWDPPGALRTARELRTLEPARLAVGHGNVLEDPLPELDRAIAVAT